MKRTQGNILIITGPESSGKTTFVTAVLTQCPNWYTINRKKHLKDALRSSEIINEFLGDVFKEIERITGQKIKYLSELDLEKISLLDVTSRNAIAELVGNAVSISNTLEFRERVALKAFSGYYQEIMPIVTSGGNIIIDDSTFIDSPKIFNIFKEAMRGYPFIKLALLKNTLANTFANCQSRNRKYKEIATLLATYREANEASQKMEQESGGSSSSFRVPKIILQNYHKLYHFKTTVNTNDTVIEVLSRLDLQTIITEMAREQDDIIRFLRSKGLIVDDTTAEFDVAVELQSIIANAPFVYVVCKSKPDYIIDGNLSLPKTQYLLHEMKNQAYLFDLFHTHDTPKNVKFFDLDRLKEDLRPCIIILGGVSSSGKTTTADAFVKRFKKTYSLYKITSLSQDKIISDDLNKKCSKLTDSLLFKRGFAEGSKIFENLHLLSLEKRTEVDAIRIYAFRLIMYSALADQTAIAITEGNFVILDVIDIAFMLSCLQKKLPTSTPIITTLLYIPLDIYPERILHRNERVLAMNNHGRLSLILKEVRLGLLKTEQYGDLYYASNDSKNPNIGFISNKKLLDTLSTAAQQQKQLITSLLLLYSQHIVSATSEDKFFAGSLEKKLNDYDIKAQSNITFSFHKIMGDVIGTGAYIKPKYSADLIIDTSKNATTYVVDSIMSKLIILFVQSVQSSLGFRVFQIDPEALKKTLIGQSLQFQRNEYEIAESCFEMSLKYRDKNALKTFNLRKVTRAYKQLENFLETSAYYEHGHFLGRQKQLDKAIAWLEKGFESQYDWQLIYNLLDKDENQEIRIDAQLLAIYLLIKCYYGQHGGEKKHVHMKGLETIASTSEMHNQQYFNKSDELYYEGTVASDGSCLFYSVAFAFLFPVAHDAELFRQRFISLFGEEEVSGAVEENRQHFIRNGGHEIIQNPEVLQILVNHNLRRRVVDFMRKHKENFLGFIPENEDFEERMQKMENPDKNSWGDQPEIAAISEMLKINLLVYQKQGGILVPFPGAEHKVEGSNTEICLLYTQASVDSTTTNPNNHYNYLLQEQDLPKNKELEMGIEENKISSAHQVEFSTIANHTTMAPTNLAANVSNIMAASVSANYAGSINTSEKNSNEKPKRSRSPFVSGGYMPHSLSESFANTTRNIGHATRQIANPLLFAHRMTRGAREFSQLIASAGRAGIPSFLRELSRTGCSPDGTGRIRPWFSS